MRKYHPCKRWINILGREKCDGPTAAKGLVCSKKRKCGWSIVMEGESVVRTNKALIVVVRSHDMEM